MAVHYKKSGIDLKKFIGFQYDLEKLLQHQKSLVKGNKSKGIYLDRTMPLWPKILKRQRKKNFENLFYLNKKKTLSKLTCSIFKAWKLTEWLVIPTETKRTLVELRNTS